MLGPCPSLNILIWSKHPIARNLSSCTEAMFELTIDALNFLYRYHSIAGLRTRAARRCGRGDHWQP